MLRVLRPLVAKTPTRHCRRVNRPCGIFASFGTGRCGCSPQCSSVWCVVIRSACGRCSRRCAASSRVAANTSCLQSRSTGRSSAVRKAHGESVAAIRGPQAATTRRDLLEPDRSHDSAHSEARTRSLTRFGSRTGLQSKSITSSSCRPSSPRSLDRRSTTSHHPPAPRPCKSTEGR